MASMADLRRTLSHRLQDADVHRMPTTERDGASYAGCTLTGTAVLGQHQRQAAADASVDTARIGSVERPAWPPTPTSGSAEYSLRQCRDCQVFATLVLAGQQPADVSCRPEEAWAHRYRHRRPRTGEPRFPGRARPLARLRRQAMDRPAHRGCAAAQRRPGRAKDASITAKCLVGPAPDDSDTSISWPSDRQTWPSRRPIEIPRVQRRSHRLSGLPRQPRGRRRP